PLVRELRGRGAWGGENGRKSLTGGVGEGMVEDVQRSLAVSDLDEELALRTSIPDRDPDATGLRIPPKVNLQSVDEAVVELAHRGKAFDGRQTHPRYRVSRAFCVQAGLRVHRRK